MLLLIATLRYLYTCWVTYTNLTAPSAYKHHPAHRGSSRKHVGVSGSDPTLKGMRISRTKRPSCPLSPPPPLHAPPSSCEWRSPRAQGLSRGAIRFIINAGCPLRSIQGALGPFNISKYPQLWPASKHKAARGVGDSPARPLNYPICDGRV